MLFIFIFLLLVNKCCCHGESGAHYELYPPSMIAIYACTSQIESSATFCDPSGYDYYYTCPCMNKAYRASLMGCLHVGGRDSPQILQGVAEYCQEYEVDVSVKDLKESYEYYLDNAKDTTEISNFSFSEPIDVPIKINETLAQLYAAGYEHFLGNYNNSLFYGTGILGYWLVVILIAAVCNWTREIFPGIVNSLTGPVSTFIRKHITLPAVHRRKAEAQPLLRIFDCLVPSRIETIIISGFIVLLIICDSVNIKAIANDPTFDSKSESIGRQIAVRSGIICSCFMPLLILFAGRNNFLQWVTKWNFATYITYHRWIGRMAFVMVAVHGIGYSVSFSKYYTLYMKDTYVIWGMIATISGGFIMVQGLLVLRRQWYEMFLLIHIVLAALFVGGAWIHVDELGYVWFYYATSAVWIFDRVVRLCRLCAFGFPLAKVELSAQETVKVTVPKPKYWKSIPGGHAFVHFLRPSCFWQSHPFTFTEAVETKENITLYCKIKGGVTHGLYQYLSLFPNKITKIRVAIEGPYGESTPARHYDSAVFIAGGNGIPGIYSEVYDLGLHTNTPNKKIKLIWIIRDYQSIDWFVQELKYLQGKPVLPVIYITKPVLEHEDSCDEKKKLNSDDEKFSDYEGELPHVEFRYGRPDIGELVKQEIEESNGSTAFITCGHPIMVDDIRYSVCQNLGPKRVDFFEQLQVWA